MAESYKNITQLPIILNDPVLLVELFFKCNSSNIGVIKERLLLFIYEYFLNLLRIIFLNGIVHIYF